MSYKSILLADDEEAVLTSIGWALEKNNFMVTTATDGQIAINKLHARQFDLVITDLRMPKIDGIGVLKEAKRLYPEIGVIVLTGYGDVGSAVQALQLGADDYLQKPCDINDLLNKAMHRFEKQDLISRLQEQNKRLKSEIAARKAVEVKLHESQASLEQQVAERTTALTQTVDELKSVLGTLLVRERELQEKNRELHDMNTTLNIILKRRDQEHIEIRDEIASKTVETVLPLLKKAQNQATGSTKDYMETAQANLLDVFSKHHHDSVLATAKLAPRELQVVHYIRQNKTSKEIADLLNLSVRTIESYRENIRKKIRIKNQKKNLKKFLTSLL
jgi:DNA-binding NarL/FixJ family response regulator